MSASCPAGPLVTSTWLPWSCSLKHTHTGQKRANKRYQWCCLFAARTLSENCGSAKIFNIYLHISKSTALKKYYYLLSYWVLNFYFHFCFYFEINPVFPILIILILKFSCSVSTVIFLIVVDRSDLFCHVSTFYTCSQKIPETSETEL